MPTGIMNRAADPVAEQFLTSLADPRRPIVDAGNVAVVVAHPDDETIGCGAQLARWRGVTVIVITGGAPRNLSPAILARFGSHQNYAEHRAAELRQALSLADVPDDNVVRLAFPDQQAAFRLAEISIFLARILLTRGIQIVLTHAYEGGHPDHDATCFAVQAAAAKVERRGQRMLLLEMPYYRAGANGWLLQKFAPYAGAREITLELSPDEQAQKRRMLAAHASQQEMLAHFSTSYECFRVAPRHDFTKQPNDGRLFYEQHEWGLTGKEWRQLAADAIGALDDLAAA